jgi:hypothetical protein
MVAAGLRSGVGYVCAWKLKQHRVAEAGEVGGEAMRESNGRFIRGHGKLGGFVKGNHHKPESKLLVSESLRAKFADEARRWRGDGASYAAKHMWISKHYGKARNVKTTHIT